MAYLTITEVLAASRATYQTRSMAESVIRKSANTPTTTWFDIFLSHSFQDAEVIVGIARLLERDGTSVYVDWRDDPQFDRSRVTADTAAVLRERMQHCHFLLYATSVNASNSKWMPWELGYFDGLRSGKVGILPILNRSDEAFIGQEYLGLYPKYEQVNFYSGPRLGRRTSAGSIETLTDSIRRSA